MRIIVRLRRNLKPEPAPAVNLVPAMAGGPSLPAAVSLVPQMHTESAPEIRPQPSASGPAPAAAKPQCKRCGSRDVWRFGRLSWMRYMIANARRGQWATCRGCGHRFVTDFYGPMRSHDEDDD